MITIKLSTLEYCAAAYTILWASFLLMGNETSLDAVAFSYLRDTWGGDASSARVNLGMTGMFVGFAYATAITVNGRGLMWTPIARAACAGFNVALFATLAFSIALVDFWSPGVSTYSSIACVFLGFFLINMPRVEHSLLIMLGRVRGSSRND
ncbi:MAG: hypothetical protein AAFQ58_19270 [Pseudomonadota bacterium]